MEKERFEMEHNHIWIKADEWSEKDPCGRRKHFTAFRCKDPDCTIEKIILEETATFAYEIDRREYWSDGE